MDLDPHVPFGSGFSQSLRHVQEQWSATVEGSVGLRTLNERIHRITPVATSAHRDPRGDVPPITQLDGIRVPIQRLQEKITPEKRKRQRHQRSGKTMVIVVALGFWSDGRRAILDGQIACSEDHQEGEVRVQRLWERGCQPERGLQLVGRDGSDGLGEALALVSGTTVPEQRCLFHQLQNVGTTCRSEHKGTEQREWRTLVMEQAAAVSQADTASDARTLLAMWGKQWRALAPQSVATLERDCEQTLVFYGIVGLTPQWIRITSL
jgi:cell division protein FtsL